MVPTLFESARCEADVTFNENATNIAAGDLAFENDYGPKIGTRKINFNHNVSV